MDWTNTNMSSLQDFWNIILVFFCSYFKRLNAFFYFSLNNLGIETTDSNNFLWQLSALKLQFWLAEWRGPRFVTCLIFMRQMFYSRFLLQDQLGECFNALFAQTTHDINESQDVCEQNLTLKTLVFQIRTQSVDWLSAFLRARWVGLV